ncbi:C_GCAxxG_C_C family protein [Parabacteroides goldsteinii CL02T12C30]|uniref:C_GCAxxG_C_C family protein n=1 Tax=Parabacteroides goldsteinii CL02T12C30 TaxID=999418 RepID=K5Z5Z1_9BACT|nr:C-GCAxxG-C-C family protein [Parabacteroides goldsteinii]EKN10989.1 C_GCAxxG_C_C family protein [Parabacteroides goldsteinii CL02T12C30]
MKEFDIEERVKIAVQNFESGYNCAQSVFLAYSDVFELNLEMAKKMSVSFGGGVGRMREVCGTVSTMAMLAGFKYPVLDQQDQEARTKNYAMVQKMSDLFKEKHGTIICRSLLPAAEASQTAPQPSARTAEYYAKRPCSKYVEDAARIAGRMLKNELD